MIPSSSQPPADLHANNIPLPTTSSMTGGNASLAAETVVRPPSSAIMSSAATSTTSAPTSASSGLGGARVLSASPSASHIAINIKCPTFPDLTFSVLCAKASTEDVLAASTEGSLAGHKILPSSATIADLKAIVAELYPSKPAVEDQRLIFAGSLLNDSQPLLTHVFKKSDHSLPQTLHLVIKNTSAIPSATSSPIPSRSAPKFVESSGLRHRFSSHSTLTPSAPQSSNDLDAEGAGKASATSTAEVAAASSTVPAPASIVTAGIATSTPIDLATAAAVDAMTGGMQAQFAAMIAAHQFAAQNNLPPPIQVVMINGIPYALQLNTNALLADPTATAASTTSTIPNLPETAPLLPPVDIGNNNHLPAPIPPAPAPAANAPANAPAGGNAIGGGFANFMQQDDENDEFGDLARQQPPNPIWLLMKLTFVVWMFSHNAGTVRFVLLNVGAFVVFFVQMGWIRFGRRPAAAAGAAGAAAPVAAPAGGEANAEGAAPVPVPGGDNAAPAEAANAIAAPAAAAAAAAAAAIPPPIQLTILQEIQTLIYTFFTSLIPDHPEVA
ncbi:hypothetical protein HDU97_005018 [Phlyctochytrium planicorne]|nr:hypothetical protein HDU97_005018 [Phlyctochytrium planicorne]